MYLLDNDDKESKKPVKKRDHRAKLNPHFGHVMKPKSRKAIASKQRLRYDLMRSALEQSKNSVSEERVREIVKETVRDYLTNNTLEVNNKKLNNIPL